MYKELNTRRNSITTNLIHIVAFSAYVCFTIMYYKKLPLGALSIIIDLILAIVLSLIFHEFGHFIAGKITGFKLHYFQILCFKWERDEFNKINFSFTKNIHLGQCVMVPVKGKRCDMYTYLLGGPLANLFLFAATLIPFAITLITINFYISLLLTFAIVNSVLYVDNRLPLVIRGIYNDGLNSELVRNYKEIEITLKNQLMLQEAIDHNMTLKQVDQYLVNNDGIVIPYNVTHSFYFTYIRGVRKLVDSDLSGIYELRKYLRGNVVIPLPYYNLASEYYMFYLIVNDMDYRYLLATKEGRKLYKEPCDYDFCQSIDFILMNYHDSKLSIEDAIKKLQEIRMNNDNISYEFEKDIKDKMCDKARSYLKSKIKEEVITNEE